MNNKQKLLNNLREADDTISELDVKLKNEKEKNRMLLDQNNKIIVENASIKKYVNEYEEKIFNLTNDYERNIKHINEQITKHKTELTHYQNHIKELENELNYKNSHISKLEKEHVNLDKTSKKYLDLSNKLKEENKILDNELLNKKIDINKFYNDISLLENELEKYKILYEERNNTIILSMDNNTTNCGGKSLHDDRYMIFSEKETPDNKCCCMIN